MSEDEAIERLEAAMAKAMDYACPSPHGYATAAWNAMKAIALEQPDTIKDQLRTAAFTPAKGETVRTKLGNRIGAA